MDERDAIDSEISGLQYLIDELDDYLTKDDIQIQRWYIFNKLNGIKYFDDTDELIENAVEYIKSLELEGLEEYCANTRISIGAEYIRNATSFGASEFICREKLNSKYTYSDDIRRVNIKLETWNMRTVEEILEILNNGK